MTEVEAFIAGHDGEQRKILNHLHVLLAHELGLMPTIRYKIPFYDYKSWICYLNPTKDGAVEFAFVRGNELSNEQGLVHSKGRKQVMSMDIATLDGIPEDSLKEVVHEALMLDETVPHASKRSMGRKW